MTSHIAESMAPAPAADSPVVVVRSWTGGSNGQAQHVLAVRAPKAADDDQPWMIYVNGTFATYAPDSRIPASADTLFPRQDADGHNVQEPAIDGVYYEVLVDGRLGIGVRNGPLTPVGLNLPWVVTMDDSYGVRRLIDTVSDVQVQVLRPAIVAVPGQ